MDFVSRYWIPLRCVSHQVVEGILLTCTMAFTPLQLIKILCQHVAMATYHLQAEFYATAVRPATHVTTTTDEEYNTNYLSICQLTMIPW